MNFEEMTGYDFENFISKKLREIGFDITQTSYSNDGGIDIVAQWAKPLFSGKYIIQCKKWIGNVGQPEIRDLYGVVMSERANKGILITTSDFTQQAHDFAAGKNLELINGFELARLFSDTDDEKQFSEITIDKIDPDFNCERYEYLLGNYKKKERNAEDKLDKFIWESFWEGHLEACKYYDLINLSIEINTARIKKAKGKEAFKAIKKGRINQFLAYLVLGLIDEATNILLEADDFYLDFWTPRESYMGGYDSDAEGYFNLDEVYCPRACARNLYIAYKSIGYDTGMETMTVCQQKFSNADYYRANYYYDYPEQKTFDTNSELEKERFFRGSYEDLIFSVSSTIPIRSTRRRIVVNSALSTSIREFCGESMNYSKKIPFSKIRMVFFPKLDKNLHKKLDVVLRRHGVNI